MIRGLARWCCRGRGDGFEGRRRRGRFFVGVVAGAGEADDVGEEGGLVVGDNAKGFQVARAGGFYMEAAFGEAGEGRVDGEFVGAGVEESL